MHGERYKSGSCFVGMVNDISGWRIVLSTTVNVSATEVLGAAPPGECVTSRLNVDRAGRLMDNNISELLYPFPVNELNYSFNMNRLHARPTA